MTLEEEKELRQKVIQTVLPLVINMTEDKIRSIIQNVEKSNEDLINKLEVVIDDDENYLVQIILMYDNCNNNIETLKNKVDKRYKNYLIISVVYII